MTQRHTGESEHHTYEHIQGQVPGDSTWFPPAGHLLLGGVRETLVEWHETKVKFIIITGIATSTGLFCFDFLRPRAHTHIHTFSHTHHSHGSGFIFISCLFLQLSINPDFCLGSSLLVKALGNFCPTDALDNLWAWR